MTDASTDTPSLQHARPRLKSGQIFGSLVSNDKDTPLIFELSDGRQQMLLPQEAALILPLLDGTRTVPDILEVLHEEEGPLPLHIFFDILQRLQLRGFIDGAELLVIGSARQAAQTRVEMHERPPVWLTRPIFSLPLSHGKVLGEPSILAFGLFALATLIITLSFLVGALSLGFVQIPIGFLRIQESYVKGLLFFFAASSVLMTAKTVIKTILSLLMTGARSALDIELGFFFLALRSGDNKIYLAGGRKMATLAFAAVTSSYFFIFAVASAVAPHWSRLDDLFWVSSIMALLDLNPFRKSDLSSYFQIVFNRKMDTNLVSYLQNRGLFGFQIDDENPNGAVSKIYFAYSALALAWTMIAFNLLLALITHGDAILATSFVAALHVGDSVEQLAILLVALAFGVSLFGIVVNILRIVSRNALFPLRSEHLAEKAKKKAKLITLENVEELAKTFSRIPLFQKLHPDALLFLISKGQVRSFPKGAPIVAQGSSGLELFILVDGTVTLRKYDATGTTEELGQISGPTVFGENSILTGSPFTADAVAASAVRVIAIPRKAVDELMHHPVLRTEAETLLDRLILGAPNLASSLFSHMPREALSLFFNEAEIVNVATGRHIVEQGRSDKDFYLLIRGSIDVIRDGQISTRLEQGDVFGESSLVYNVPRSETMMTREPSRLLKLSSRQFWSVLSKHAATSLCLGEVNHAG